MPVITGKQLDEMAEEAVKWYVNTRQFLIKALEEGGYAYGSLKLSQADQMRRISELTPQQWREMYMRRLNRYRGLPNADDLATNDMRDFLQQAARIFYGGQG
jgi:hypothetical protein